FFLVDYSTYSQAAAQQGYSAYAPQPAQGYAQTTQVKHGEGAGIPGNFLEKSRFSRRTR
ncbi:EWS protein, partial [Pomatostomus ruficeps]|nr:EWS protein [Pomatostomus ruficeps]